MARGKGMIERGKGVMTTLDWSLSFDSLGPDTKLSYMCINKLKKKQTKYSSQEKGSDEWADRLAKSSTTMSDSCVRHIKISQNLFKSKINDWLSRSWESEWLSATTNSPIRTLIPSFSSFKLFRKTPPPVKSFN